MYTYSYEIITRKDNILFSRFPTKADRSEGDPMDGRLADLAQIDGDRIIRMFFNGSYLLILVAEPTLSTSYK